MVGTSLVTIKFIRIYMGVLHFTTIGRNNLVLSGCLGVLELKVGLCKPFAIGDVLLFFSAYIEGAPTHIPSKQSDVFQSLLTHVGLDKTNCNNFG